MGAVCLGVLMALSVLGLAVAFLPRVSAVTCAPVDHGSILITKDSDFTTANGVKSGSGTATDPFLISNVKLNDLSPGYGLKVDNTKGGVTKYFNVQCVQSSYTTLPKSGVAKLIWFVNVHTTTVISDMSGNPATEIPGTTGVQLDSSSNIKLDNLSLNKLGTDGVNVNSSDHVSIFHSKLKALHNGLTIINSHDVSGGDVCDLSALSNTCNELTYDDGRGISVSNSYNINFQYTKTNADDTGGILLDGSGTYAVSLTNGVSSGNGPICPQNVGIPTGAKVDTIGGIAVTNGAHDINVKGYTINGNTHFDILNGGDKQYPNPCTGLTETLSGKATPPGGANLDFNGNCWHLEFGFNPVPTDTC